MQSHILRREDLVCARCGLDWATLVERELKGTPFEQCVESSDENIEDVTDKAARWELCSTETVT